MSKSLLSPHSREGATVLAPHEGRAAPCTKLRVGGLGKRSSARSARSNTHVQQPTVAIVVDGQQVVDTIWPPSLRSAKMMCTVWRSRRFAPPHKVSSPLPLSPRLSAPKDPLSMNDERPGLAGPGLDGCVEYLRLQCRFAPGE